MAGDRHRVVAVEVAADDAMGRDGPAGDLAGGVEGEAPLPRRMQVRLRAVLGRGRPGAIGGALVGLLIDAQLRVHVDPRPAIGAEIDLP